MLKRLATILNRLGGFLFTAPLVQMEIKHSVTANSLPVKSGQPCKDALTLAKQKPKRKPKAAPSTTPAKSRKPKQKPAQPAGKASGATGSQPRTRASKTRQHVK